MSNRPEEFVERLHQLDADHSRSANELMALLRAQGIRAGDAVLREGIQAYVDKFTKRDNWATRHEAAEALGVSVQRVDQLRRAGLLRSELNIHTRKVRIYRDSLDLLIAQRNANVRLDPDTIPGYAPSVPASGS